MKTSTFDSFVREFKEIFQQKGTYEHTGIQCSWELPGTCILKETDRSAYTVGVRCQPSHTITHISHIT